MLNRSALNQDVLNGDGARIDRFVGLGIVGDTSSSNQMTPTVPLRLAKEKEQVSPVVRHIKVIVGTASEAESLPNLSHGVQWKIELAQEWSKANPFDRNVGIILGVAKEIDSAIRLYDQWIQFGQGNEVDKAVGINIGHGIALNLGVEADTALPITYAQAIVPGIAGESDKALRVNPAPTVLLGIATEYEIAFSATHYFPGWREQGEISGNWVEEATISNSWNEDSGL